MFGVQHTRFRHRVNILKHMSFLGKEVIREAEKDKDEESKCEREKLHQF